MTKLHLLCTAALGLTLVFSGCRKELPESSVQRPEVTTEAVSVPVDLFDTDWTPEQSQPILEKTMRLHLDYDDSQLSDNEKLAVSELLAAGKRFHILYLDQVHPQNREIHARMQDPDMRQDIKELFWMNDLPFALDLDYKPHKILNAEDLTSAKNVYPIGTERADLEAFFIAHPDRKNEITDLRAVVMAATPENKKMAFEKLDNYPTLEILHPGIRERIETAEIFFGLPYSIRYAEDIFYIYDRLQKAADHIETEDIAFARYLRSRARDILADNYDGSDAMWITGDFTGNLNAQIGSYETYDDTIMGVKSFFSLSLLIKDKPKSEELSNSLGDIQAIENALPYEYQKSVSNRIPVGVYNIVADFGQARGTNTATILPNEGHLSRQFGRTILIRSNILRNERIFESSLRNFQAGTALEFHGDLDLEGNFYRTLWHEIGHYLGPVETKDGDDVEAMLQETGDLLEEMKADLISLFAAPRLHANGNYTDARLRSIYAAGILRVLRKNQPKRTQPYGTMQLIQFNWFLDKGLIRFEDNAVHIDYDRYPEAVESLLKAVLAIQYEGDKNRANAFIDRWTKWDPHHALIAEKLRAAEKYRFRLVTYEALKD